MNQLPYLAALCLALLPGCATEQPRGPQGSFSVKVVPFFGNDVRVYAQAYERVNGQRNTVLTSKRVTGDGVVGFVLPLDHTYGVRAYADVDQDGKQGPADPSTSVENLRPVADVNMQQVPVILALPGAGVAPDWPHKKNVPGTAATSEDALLQQGLEEAQEIAPRLPVPPPPLPVPPPPP
jgi:hypothetical protein